MEIRAATVALELLRKASLTETIIDSDSKFISESSIWMAMVRVAAACWSLKTLETCIGISFWPCQEWGNGRAGFNVKYQWDKEDILQEKNQCLALGDISLDEASQLWLVEWGIQNRIDSSDHKQGWQWSVDNQYPISTFNTQTFHFCWGRLSNYGIVLNAVLYT